MSASHTCRPPSAPHLALRARVQLFDLEPAKQVTGGPWYTEQVLDTEFIDGVRRAALNALEQAGGAPSSARDIAAFIREGGAGFEPGTASPADWHQRTCLVLDRNRKT